MTFSRPSFRRPRLVVVGAVFAFALWAAPSAFASCSYPAAGQSFARWHDPASYVPAPNGGLEAASANWTLSGNASVVEGNESFFLNDPLDSHSLAIPDGSSATTPSFCLSAGFPTFRFMVRNGGNQWAALRVDVLFVDSDGAVARKTAGYVLAGRAWQPSWKLAIGAGLADVGRDGTTSAQLQFTPVGRGGDFQVDDLFIDPLCRR